MAVNGSQVNRVIDLEEPILGLGKEYEPEYVWGAKTGGLEFPLDVVSANPRLLDSMVPVYPDESTARTFSQRYGVKGCIYVREVPLGYAISVAHSRSLPLVLIDSDLNILKEWPV